MPFKETNGFPVLTEGPVFNGVFLDADCISISSVGAGLSCNCSVIELLLSGCGSMNKETLRFGTGIIERGEISTDCFLKLDLGVADADAEPFGKSRIGDRYSSNGVVSFLGLGILRDGNRPEKIESSSSSDSTLIDVSDSIPKCQDESKKVKSTFKNVMLELIYP